MQTQIWRDLSKMYYHSIYNSSILVLTRYILKHINFSDKNKRPLKNDHCAGAFFYSRDYLTLKGQEDMTKTRISYRKEFQSPFGSQYYNYYQLSSTFLAVMRTLPTKYYRRRLYVVKNTVQETLSAFLSDEAKDQSYFSLK